jgi:hypothetical protein
MPQGRHSRGQACPSFDLASPRGRLAKQGTWLCSLRGDCSWTVLAAGSTVSAVELLRVLRVARIAWILKHFRAMRVATLLGGLMVRAAYAGSTGREAGGARNSRARVNRAFGASKGGCARHQ